MKLVIQNSHKIQVLHLHFSCPKASEDTCHLAAGPVVENDLLSITPVLLRPTLSSSPVEAAPSEAKDSTSLSAGPPIKKPRLQESSDPQEQQTSAPP